MNHLDRDRWQTISKHLDRLLDLPAEEREPYLDHAFGSDAELRSEVLRVWKEMETEEGGESQAAGLLGGALGGELLSESEADDLAPGTTVGAYRVLREIGHGGMGTVYLAERADGAYEQYVALKRVRRGLDTKAVLRRFLHERQVLARLEHPNIARLLDAGVTGDGLPYFVMEHVEGEPITDYCDRHRLTVKERLALFDEVCRAVRYAHQNLVVHRDLKPSNVLVAEGEDGPYVKLLDFGIAKVLHEEDEAPLTRLGGRVLTPEYGAPEQARGGAVTTATDVYALGVMLYELLAGQRPFRPTSAAEGSVRRPSSVVADAPIAEGRRATVPQLRKLLRGDLDHIVLKALRPEPDRRYGTAEELRLDLQRHREGFPVEARAEGIGYRVSRFVQRHRGGVAAAAAVAVALVVGLGAALWQASRAEAEAARARTEATTAAQATAFLAGLFESANPIADPAMVGSDTLSVRNLVERGRERIETELDGEPLVQANLLRVLGDVYLNLGLYGESEELLSRSDSLYDLTPGVRPFEHAQTLILLGDAIHLGGDTEAAAVPFEEALALSERIEGLRERAQVLKDVGLFRHHQGRYDEAEALARRVLRGIRPTTRSDSLRIEETLALLGLTLYAAGRYDEAETAHREGYRLALDLYGSSHPTVARAANNLAGVLRQQGRGEEAERYYREALAVYRRANADETHPIIARSLNNLGVFLVGQGRMEEGEAALREALDLYRRRLGEDHPEVALGFINVAGLRRRQGDYADALSLYDRALAIQRARLAPDHFHLGRTLGSSALTASLAGDSERAARHYAEALRIFLVTFGPEHARSLGARLGLGRAYLALGRRTEAREVLLAARSALPAEADSTLRADILAALEEAG